MEAALEAGTAMDGGGCCSPHAKGTAVSVPQLSPPGGGGAAIAHVSATGADAGWARAAAAQTSAGWAGAMSASANGSITAAEGGAATTTPHPPPPLLCGGCCGSGGSASWADVSGSEGSALAVVGGPDGKGAKLVVAQGSPPPLAFV